MRSMQMTAAQSTSTRMRRRIGLPPRKRPAPPASGAIVSSSTNCGSWASTASTGVLPVLPIAHRMPFDPSWRPLAPCALPCGSSQLKRRPGVSDSARVSVPPTVMQQEPPLPVATASAGIAWPIAPSTALEYQLIGSNPEFRATVRSPRTGRTT